jgi:NADH dehydrogenase FAD-containing subunit
MKNIVIVGGGPAGVDLAKRLDALANVTLVDGKDSFVHSPASIRAVTDSALLDQLIMPYENLLVRGKFVQGWVQSIQEDGVELTDGNMLAADIIVVAPGSNYAKPFKHTAAGLVDYRAQSTAAAALLREANTVVIVGAGPVGTELAGEIAYAYPNKTVHLITDEKRLFPMYPSGLAGKLEADLGKMGVKIHTGKMVENLQKIDEPYVGSVQLPGGESIDADIVFPAIGGRPQTELLTALNDVQLSSEGRVEHDGWMRPSKSRDNLFVVGDALASGDAMTIVAISRQVPWLEKAIKAVLAGKTAAAVKPYTPWKVAPIILPLGPKLGSTLLPFGKHGKAVGHFMTSRMKGRDLFIPKYRKLFGLD